MHTDQTILLGAMVVTPGHYSASGIKWPAGSWSGSGDHLNSRDNHSHGAGAVRREPRRTQQHSVRLESEKPADRVDLHAITTLLERRR